MTRFDCSFNESLNSHSWTEKLITSQLQNSLQKNFEHTFWNFSEWFFLVLRNYLHKIEIVFVLDDYTRLKMQLWWMHVLRHHQFLSKSMFSILRMRRFFFCNFNDWKQITWRWKRLVDFGNSYRQVYTFWLAVNICL